MRLIVKFTTTHRVLKKEYRKIYFTVNAISESYMSISDRVDVNRLLLEMRSLKAQTQAFGNADVIKPAGNGLGDVNTNGANSINNGPKFGDLLTQAVDKVNNVQQESKSMTNAYLQGDSSVDITDVMIASQKSSVAFDSMVQVRNKFVDAYRDVMNMPI